MSKRNFDNINSSPSASPSATGKAYGPNDYVPCPKRRFWCGRWIPCGQIIGYGMNCTESFLCHQCSELVEPIPGKGERVSGWGVTGEWTLKPIGKLKGDIK